MAYTLEQLRKRPFFSKYVDIELVLDYLSGVISRGAFLDYANYLIENKKPFSFFIIDIDNFKNVNDTYGHQVGDYLISMLAQRLIDSVGQDGLIGRYGGDEFVVISEKHIDYDEMWNFIKDIYNAIRRNFTLNGDEMLLTITSGGASYPKDANDYDSLFKTADKALYRGKEKGRNCFIIYVEEKHKDIITNAVRENQMNYRIEFLYNIFATEDTQKNRLKKCFDYLFSLYSISGFYIEANTGKVLFSRANDSITTINLNDVENLFSDSSSIAFNDYSALASTNYEFHKYCYENDWKSFTCFKIYAFDAFYGYLFFVDKSRKRIWQNDDKILFSFLAKLAGLSEYYENKK